MPRKVTIEEFIERARAVHGDKYDYSKVNYINNKTEVTIICPIHGEFSQRPDSHLQGKGCKYCSNPSYKYTTEEFIKISKTIHGNKYDYSKTNYIDSNTKVIITCPIHGDFKQKPHEHLRSCGCQKCNQSHLEKDIEKLLQNNNIEYEYNKYYKELDNLQLDFYIPSLKIGIECQGKQHFNAKYGWSSNQEKNEKQFQLLQQRDALKRELCEKNGIKLLYYSDLGIDYPYEVIEDKNLILEELIIAKDKLL